MAAEHKTNYEDDSLTGKLNRFSMPYMVTMNKTFRTIGRRAAAASYFQKKVYGLHVT